MNFAPLYAAPLIMHVHIALAISSMIVGAFQFLKKKGTKIHRTAGWLWVLLMIGVGISAVLLPPREPGVVKLTGVLVIWLCIGLPCAIIAIKRGNILLHRAFMLGLYFGGLLIAAAFTLTPGRLLYKIFFQG